MLTIIKTDKHFKFMIPQKWDQPATFSGVAVLQISGQQHHERQARQSFCFHGGPLVAFNQLRGTFCMLVVS